MRKYETVVIFSQNLNDAELKTEVSKFQKFLEANQGTIVSIETWGKRELAFLIKKQRFGSYVCYRYDTDNHDLVSKFMALLLISDNVLYSQSHKISDRVRKVKTNPFHKPSESGEFEITIGDMDY